MWGYSWEHDRRHITPKVYPTAKEKKKLIIKLITDGNWNKFWYLRKQGAVNWPGVGVPGQGQAIHGNKGQRLNSFSWFKDGSLSTCCWYCTWLGYSLLPHVINFELPNIPEVTYQVVRWWLQWWNYFIIRPGGSVFYVISKSWLVWYLLKCIRFWAWPSSFASTAPIKGQGEQQRNSAPKEASTSSRSSNNDFLMNAQVLTAAESQIIFGTEDHF
jgi:hypothetical protein